MKTPKYFYFRVKTINKGTALDIEDASDVDVVEVVRCKECEYGIVDDPEIPFLRFCEYNGQDWNDENHYCGHAKRREVTE